MDAPRTVRECKNLLFKLAIKHGVAPNLISERLLSKSDKEDMLNGLLPFETLDCAVKLWANYGMCNYSDGSGGWYRDFWSYKAKRVECSKKVSTIANLPPRN